MAPKHTTKRFSTLTPQENRALDDLHGHLDDWLARRSDFADINGDIGQLLKALGWQPSARATLFV